MAGDGTFTGGLPNVGVADSGSGAEMATGDFNNDARPDIVAASGLGTASLRLGDGDGTFSAGGNVALGTGPFGVVVADFNGDGFDDLAVTNRGIVSDNGPDQVSIRLRNGPGTFSSATDVVVGDLPLGLAAGELNNDGFEDFVVANNDDGDVSVRLGNGNGTFSSPADVSVGANPRDLVIDDFDGDGVGDLAVATLSGGVFIREGNGNGTFTNEPDVAATGLDVVSGDLDLDGDPDLVIGSQNAGQIQVRLGNGDGTFTAAPDAATGVAQIQEPLVADFNSDGLPDIAALLPSPASLVVRLGNGDGTFDVIPNLPLGGGVSPSMLVTADWDSDGNQDLAVRDSTTDLVDDQLLIRRGAGTAPLAGNLLVNGGFEGSSRANDPATPAPPPITGWERSGNITAARYGMRFSSIFLRRLDAPLFATGGENYLFGGAGPGPATTTAFQTVDVGGSASSIDGGEASSALSAYLGAGNVFDDRMSATARFLDAGGGELGSFVIGPVTAAERKNQTTLLKRAANAAIPLGTRSIRVSLEAVNLDAGGSSAFADNVKLTLDAPDTRIEVALSGKKKQKLLKKKAVLVKATCPIEACTVEAGASARVRKGGGKGAKARTIRTRTLTAQLDPGAPRTLKLKLAKKALKALKSAKKPKFTVTATATDVIGNTASEELSVRGRG
jgi:hypothetical protein